MGSIYESSSARGVNEPHTGSFSWSGAAYLFRRTDSNWNQQAYIKASNTGARDWFGRGVALSADGSTLAVAAPKEGHPPEIGSNPDHPDYLNSIITKSFGAVYLY